MGALELAKLRLDGFVSLDAEKEGSLVTKPFLLDGGEIYVNSESQEGELRAEVVNADTMDALPGLSLADCYPVKADELRARISWQQRPTPTSQEPVRLRFKMSRSKLYAFWLAE